MCTRCIDQLKADRKGRDGVPEAFEDGMLYLSELTRKFVAAKELFKKSTDAPPEIFADMEHLALSAAQRFSDAARFARELKEKPQTT